MQCTQELLDRNLAVPVLVDDRDQFVEKPDEVRTRLILVWVALPHPAQFIRLRDCLP